MSATPTTDVHIYRVTAGAANDMPDTVATEEPLEIRLVYFEKGINQKKSISVTMRTPGHDEELATGLLYNEGIVKGAQEIANVGMLNPNVVQVTVSNNARPSLGSLERNFYTTSSCGVCGKASIEAVHAACPVIDTKDTLQVKATMLHQLPAALHGQQQLFSLTGGIHGCAVFSIEGRLLMAREDVGRHNAMDKVTGALLKEGRLPASEHILLLSGRASFELVQKAAMSGIKIVAAVGAPSSLAVQMAADWGMTLVGFLKEDRFNVYSGVQRIVI